MIEMRVFDLCFWLAWAFIGGLWTMWGIWAIPELKRIHRSCQDILKRLPKKETPDD